MQPCQFRFLTNHCQARAANPRKQPEKTRVRIRGVFGRVEKRFPGPEKFTRKEPRKVFGPGSFEKRTPGEGIEKAVDNVPGENGSSAGDLNIATQLTVETKLAQL